MITEWNRTHLSQIPGSNAVLVDENYNDSNINEYLCHPANTIVHNYNKIRCPSLTLVLISGERLTDSAFQIVCFLYVVT